ncbi:MAG: protein-disulfide reductase DsbD family protein [Rhodoferax sp.]
MRILISFLALLLGTWAPAAWAQGSPAPFLDQTNPPALLERAAPGAVVQTPQVRAELLAHAPQGWGAGQPVWLGLWLQHQRGWHTYWRNPGDAGAATTLEWTLPAGVRAGEIRWPTPGKQRVGKLANYGYEDAVLLTVALTLPAQGLGATLPVRLKAGWLVCEKECVPQEGEFALQLSTRAPLRAHAALFAAAERALPRPAPQVRASAQATPEGLRVQVQGLPAAWQGQALTLFPETPEVLEPRSTPDGTQTPGATGAPGVGEQVWDGPRWSALVPYAAYRSASPAQLPVLLALGTQGLSLNLAVQGPWPAPAPLPAALEAEPGLPAPAPPLSLWLALGGALLGGLLLNLMPCVFPVLAIKVLAFSRHHEDARAHRLQGLTYTAGVVLSMLALAALLLGLRAAGEQLGWGFQLQSPGVVAALALLFTLIGLNLGGLFELGSVLPGPLASLQLRHPAADAFLSGVLAVAVATPCTAPFMGAALGAALTLPAAAALAVFAALGLGLAAPYLLASFTPALERWLPRPGAWMDSLRRFLAFFMAATVLWLLWVLGHLAGIDGAMALAAALLSLSLLLWSWQQQGRLRLVFTIISIALLLITTRASWQRSLEIAALDTTAPASTPARAAADTQGPRWEPWSEQTVQAALAAQQAVFVDFTAAWCITCQYNKATVLSDPAVLAAFAQHGVQLLRADWTRRDPAITRALQALGRSGVPVYVLLAPGRAPRLFSEILDAQELRDALATL